MQRILLIILLLIFSCDTNQPVLEGCTFGQACNYNKDATQEDGSCDFETCVDCLGYFFGTAVADSCGTCDAEPTNDCVQDCAGVWGGELEWDCAGICGGDNSSYDGC